MPGALVSALAARLKELQATLGSGTPDVAPVLSGIRAVLADVATATGRSLEATRWSGAAATAAAEFTAATVSSVEALAERAGQLGSATADATAAVTRARDRLQSIVDEFEARAAELEASSEPGTADELIAESRRALAEARAVLAELRTELDGHRAAVAAPVSAPASTTPMGMPSLSGLGGGSGPGSGSALGSGSSGLGSVLGASSPGRPLGQVVPARRRIERCG